MKAVFARLFTVNQNPRYMDVALLLLRVMVISSLVYHHGSDKIPDWDLLTHRKVPLDPIGIGVVPSLVYATFADLICGSLVILGFATRIASFFCAICVFTVAFFIDHALTTPYWPVPHGNHAEMCWIYTAVCVFLMIAGPGRYSLDAKFFQGKAQKKPAVAVAG
jgi:putative oxidoreductase